MARHHLCSGNALFFDRVSCLTSQSQAIPHKKSSLQSCEATENNVCPLLTGDNPHTSRWYGSNTYGRFLDLSANRKIVLHRELFLDITWAGGIGMSMRCAAVWRVEKFFYLDFSTRGLCNEACTCSNSKFGLRWNDQCAGPSLRDFHLDNTPAYALWGAKECKYQSILHQKCKVGVLELIPSSALH